MDNVVLLYSGKAIFDFMCKVREMLMNDLDTIFKSILVANNREGRIMYRKQICEQISRMPAPRLYITPEYALRVVRGHPRCGAIKAQWSKRQQEEVRRRYYSLPEDARTLTNLAKALEQPAESFYIPPKQISNLLYQVYAKNNRRKQA